MHAVVLTHPSLDAFTPTDLPTPSSPGHDQIHVGMRAASLNYIDIAVESARRTRRLPVAGTSGRSQ